MKGLGPQVDLGIHTVSEAMNIINEAVGGDANVIFGAVIDPELETGVRITVIATGFGPALTEERPRETRKPQVKRESALDQLINRTRRPEPASDPAGEQEETPSLGTAFLKDRYERVAAQDNLNVPTFLRKQMDQRPRRGKRVVSEPCLREVEQPPLHPGHDPLQPA